MGNRRTDEYIGRWFRQKYYIDRGFIKPVPPAPGGGISEGTKEKHISAEDYNPFDFYRPGEKGSLHHIFASLDIEDHKSIEGFCSRFGLLGLFNREILKVVSYNPALAHLFKLPKHSPVAGVQRDSDELMPMDELMDRFHIPEERMPIPQEGQMVMPDTRITVLDTWESLKDFKRECKEFKWIMNLRDALANKDTDKIRNVFRQGHEVYKETAEKDDDTLLILRANNAIIWAINLEMDKMVSPFLSFDDSSNEISKSITWRCDSLLTALYMMIFLDITRGVYTRRCRHEKCPNYFESKTADKKYCSDSCERAARQQRYRQRIEKTVSLYREGKTTKEIAIDVGTEESQVIKWLEKSKEGK